MGLVQKGDPQLCWGGQHSLTDHNSADQDALNLALTPVSGLSFFLTLMNMVFTYISNLAQLLTYPPLHEVDLFHPLVELG